MKYTKGFSILIVIIALTLAFLGCGDDDNPTIPRTSFQAFVSADLTELTLIVPIRPDVEEAQAVLKWANVSSDPADEDGWDMGPEQTPPTTVGYGEIVIKVPVPANYDSVRISLQAGGLDCGGPFCRENMRNKKAYEVFVDRVNSTVMTTKAAGLPKRP